MKSRSWRITPNTALGRWSVGLIVVMPILFVIGSTLADSMYKSVTSGESIWADIIERPALALTMLAGMAAGISAFITGLLGMIRKKEHALLVYFSTLIGALLILFLAGEVISPHL